MVLRNRRIGLLSQGSVNTEYGIQAHRREHRQAAGAARGSPQLARRNEVCGGTLTMSAPRRLVLQLRRYRCNVATAASGLGRVKTKSNLAVALSGGGIFAFFLL